MEATDMDVDTMERGRLKLMLSQDTSEDMVVMEVMDMDVDTMERGTLKLSQDILEGMVVMGVDMDMVVTDMVDMVILVEFFQQITSLPKQPNMNKVFHSK